MVSDLSPSASLPIQASLKKSSNEFWVQEQMYGHRFVQEQEPYMIVLEFLSVCRGAPLGSNTAVPGAHEEIHYHIPWQQKLRFLIFQERHLEQVSADEGLARDVKWNKWKQLVNEQYKKSFNTDQEENFGYLDDRLNCNFEALLQAVRILRSLEIDTEHNRRWTSQFIAVTGPNLLLHDLAIQKGQWSTDRRFFGRGGELVYLMINRSKLAKECSDLISRRLLSSKDSMDCIAAQLNDPNDGTTGVGIGYLPLENHQAYERIAGDWLKVLKLKLLPNSHLFEPLVRLTGLNLIRYLAERSSEIIGRSAEPFVLDLTAGRDAQLRAVSKNYFERHRHAGNEAVRLFVDTKVQESPVWSDVVKAGDKTQAAELIQQLFKIKSTEDLERLSPRAQIDQLVDLACSRSKNNIYSYFPVLAKHVGLANARQRVGTWLSPNDEMLIAIILANVEASMEINDFVESIYIKYGIIIGPNQARLQFSRLPCDIRSFENNLLSLEHRLSDLGFTRRLSDDCAFVINPYFTQAGEAQ